MTPMKVLAVPKESRLLVGLCFVVQAVALYRVARNPGASIGLMLVAFFLATYLADLITAIFHFGFDYVWPDRFPIMGPISVEFREHHAAPTLDPSDWVSNLTRGAYMGIPFALFAMNSGSYLVAATLMGISLWGVGFHQIHSYAHMGSLVPPEEFNATVARISALPKGREQQREFEILFARVGIPAPVRLLQRIGLFLKPEIHWQHHQSFDSDFSSLNGWSDPLTNIVFGPIARLRKAQKAQRA